MGDYDAALDAACTVIWPEGYDGRQRMRMSNALASAVVDLSSADFAPLAGPFLAGQLDKLAGQLAKVEELVVDHRAECERTAAAPIEYPKHWGSSAIEAEQLHRERMAKLSADAAFQRGVAIGRAEGEGTVLDGQLVTSGPDDYEPWADALHLAVKRLGNEADRRELLDCAKWFHAQLLAGPPEPPVPDCLHCGGDSDSGHADGCPFSTYPGHDMSVTVGACRPDSPCPACLQRIDDQGQGYADRPLPWRDSTGAIG